MAVACLLCGQAAGDPEHAFPRWLQKLNNPANEPVLGQLPSLDVVPVRGWNFGRMRHICTRCNQWMGGRFERVVAPLIKRLDTGTQYILDRGEQQLLAAWAYKTSLMLEGTIDGRSPIPPTLYHRFRVEAVPPASCSIVMATGLHRSLAYHRSFASADTEHGEVPEYLAALLVAGHVVFHITISLRDATRDLHPEVMGDQLGATLHRIWPSTHQELTWPLRSALEAPALERLASMFGDDFTLLDPPSPESVEF